MIHTILEIIGFGTIGLVVLGVIICFCDSISNVYSSISNSNRNIDYLCERVAILEKRKKARK